VAWLFCSYDVDAAAESVSDYTAGVASSFVALRSGPLRQLLDFVRDMVNTMNSTNPGHKAQLAGFSLKSLARLKVGHICDFQYNLVLNCAVASACDGCCWG
jgi:hypothetical protein